MKLSKQDILSILIILALFIFAITVYPKMPDKMPTHWNAKGEINGYGNRFVGLFLLPIIITGIFVLLLFIPRIEVYKENIASFMKHYNWLKLVLVLFFAAFYIVTILPNFGYSVNVLGSVIFLIGLLFIYLGFIMRYVKRNYFIGIRTPWTLASEIVWDRTHKLASKTFIANGIIILLSLLVPSWIFLVMIVTLVINVISLFVYSYYIWKKEKKK